MVDELGGVEDAIVYAAKEAELKPGTYEVRTVPAPRTLADIFNGGGDGADAALPFKPKIELGLDALFGPLDPSMRKLITSQLHAVEMLQHRPVLLLAPYVVTVK
jgi:hypothetical protein